MYCTRCGKEVPDQAKYCRYCGSSLSRPAAPQSPVTRAPVRKKSRAPVIILCIAAVVILALLAVFAVLRFRSGEKENPPERTQAPRASHTSEASEASETSEAPAPEPVRYSYYIDNCSWTEALERTSETGGRMAVLESPESFEDLTRALDDAGFTGTRFLIGARRDTGSREYRWVDEHGAPTGEVLNDPDSWAYSFWLEGEPSYRTDSAEETCVEICYDADAGRWGFRDVPDAPCDPASGQCGYIAVYDTPVSAPAEPSGSVADSGAPSASAPGEAPGTVPADYVGAYTAYLSELESNRFDIEAYTYGEQAALCDVYGDEVPELFFISAEPDSHGSRTFSYLNVCTFEDGMLRTLYTCQIHIAAGGGMDYCVFGSSLDKGIAIYLSSPGETQVVRQLTVIRDWDNPEIAAERRTALEAGMDAGSTYTAYGLTTDEAGYENACRDTLSGFEQTILTNCGDRAPDFIRAFIGTADAGDSYASLTAYLQDEITRFSAPAGSAPVPEAAAAAYTEEELRSIVSAYGTIGLWCCEDFDGDGTKEAYALTVAGGAEDLHGIDRVYFVDSQGNLTAMASDITADYYDQEDGYYLTCQGKGFFHVDYGAYGSGYSTMLFSVRNGQPYELALSRQIQGFQLRDGVFYTTENDFSAGFHQYPECELLYDPSAQEFYKGSRIGE